MLDTSAKFFYLSFRIKFNLQIRNSGASINQKENDMIYASPKMIYIDIGYKSASS